MKPLLMLAALASAQLAASPVYGARSDDLAVEALHNFGICVVRFTPDGARDVLSMDFRTDEYRKRLGRLARGHDRCTQPRTELSFNGVLFAGALAEALLEESGRRVLGQLSVVDDLTSAPPARSPLEEMALCSVMSRPAAVGRLLESDVASEKEAEAVEALSPTLSACLPATHKAELNRPALRSVLALAAWRIASVKGTGGAKEAAE